MDHDSCAHNAKGHVSPVSAGDFSLLVSMLVSYQRYTRIFPLIFHAAVITGRLQKAGIPFITTTLNGSIPEYAQGKR